uniref:Uncharacterized protein n=1 Tax=Peronospora matthiolae TaxID=2874970 RepID=A0AAV1UN95_9STRA
MMLYGATNKAGEQVLNMMTSDHSLFMHFSIRLNFKTAANLLERVQDVRRSLRVSLDINVEDDVKVLEEVAKDADVASKVEPMWTFQGFASCHDKLAPEGARVRP